MSSSTPLGAFCNQLIRFFQELSETFPEERDIKLALETIQGARRINPRLVLDMFWEHVILDLRDPILREDEQTIIAHARSKIEQQFNEIMPALAIFDKHWITMDDSNRQAIWKYLKVLIILAEKARSQRL